MERPFATVPYLGRGNGNPELESQLQQGDQVINRKSVNHLAEKSYINHRYTPMIPELASSITNPAYFNIPSTNCTLSDSCSVKST